MKGTLSCKEHMCPAAPPQQGSLSHCCRDLSARQLRAGTAEHGKRDGRSQDAAVAAGSSAGREEGCGLGRWKLSGVHHLVLKQDKKRF